MLPSVTTVLWFWPWLQRYWHCSVYYEEFCYTKLLGQCQVWHASISMESSTRLGKVRSFSALFYLFLLPLGESITSLSRLHPYPLSIWFSLDNMLISFWSSHIILAFGWFEIIIFNRTWIIVRMDDSEVHYWIVIIHAFMGCWISLVDLKADALTSRKSKCKSGIGNSVIYWILECPFKMKFLVFLV